MTKSDRVFALLSSGRNFTVAQLAGMAATTDRSVTSRIAELRSEGYAIYTNTLKNGKSAYRLGRPSRAMVRAAHAAAGAQLFQ